MWRRFHRRRDGDVRQRARTVSWPGWCGLPPAAWRLFAPHRIVVEIHEVLVRISDGQPDRRSFVLISGTVSFFVVTRYFAQSFTAHFVRGLSCADTMATHVRTSRLKRICLIGTPSDNEQVRAATVGALLDGPAYATRPSSRRAIRGLQSATIILTSLPGPQSLHRIVPNGKKRNNRQAQTFDRPIR